MKLFTISASDLVTATSTKIFNTSFSLNFSSFKTKSLNNKFIRQLSI